MHFKDIPVGAYYCIAALVLVFLMVRIHFLWKSKKEKRFFTAFETITRNFKGDRLQERPLFEEFWKLEPEIPEEELRRYLNKQKKEGYLVTQNGSGAATGPLYIKTQKLKHLLQECAEAKAK